MEITKIVPFYTMPQSTVTWGEHLLLYLFCIIYFIVFFASRSFSVCLFMTANEQNHSPFKTRLYYFERTCCLLASCKVRNLTLYTFAPFRSGSLITKAINIILDLPSLQQNGR